METIKSIFWKPDPAAQLRKCTASIRQSGRNIDRELQLLKALESKTKNLILQTSRRPQKNAAQAKQVARDTRIYARELIRIRKQSARLATSKAQLESVGMQVREAFTVRKIEGSIRTSTRIMKDVNALVRLPELTGTMRELSQELVKAGIIEEMVGDMMPDESLAEGEDEEVEAEVDKVLGEVLQGKLGKLETKPLDEVSPVQEPIADAAATADPEEEDESTEVTLEQMRGRLEALKS